MLEVFGDILNPSGLGFELLVSGALRVMDDVTIEHATVTFVGVNSPTANLVDIVAGKTLILDTASIVRRRPKAPSWARGTLHNLGTINTNIGYNGTGTSLQLSVHSFTNEEHFQRNLPRWTTSGQLTISSNDFTN